MKALCSKCFSSNMECSLDKNSETICKKCEDAVNPNPIVMDDSGTV